MRRLLLSFLLTPFVAASVAWLLLALAAQLPAVSGTLPPVLPLFEDAPFVFGWSLLIAVAVTAVGVVPLALWARAHAKLTLRRVLISGPFLGAAPFFIVAIAAGARALVESEPARIQFVLRICAPFVALGAVTGGLTAAAFFLVAVRHVSPREPA